jgi:hypothetical protein
MGVGRSDAGGRDKGKGVVWVCAPFLHTLVVLVRTLGRKLGGKGGWGRASARARVFFVFFSVVFSSAAGDERPSPLSLLNPYSLSPIHNSVPPSDRHVGRGVDAQAARPCVRPIVADGAGRSCARESGAWDGDGDGNAAARRRGARETCARESAARRHAAGDCRGNWKRNGKGDGDGRRARDDDGHVVDRWREGDDGRGLRHSHDRHSASYAPPTPAPAQGLAGRCKQGGCAQHEGERQREEGQEAAGRRGHFAFFLVFEGGGSALRCFVFASFFLLGCCACLGRAA